MSQFDVTTLHSRRAAQRWNRVPVGDIFERLTWSAPDKVAIVGWDGAYAAPAFARVTYREADAIANRIAHALLAEGLERDDRVLLLCDNSVEALLTLFGIAKAGLVAAPVNPLMAPDVVAHAAETVDPRLLIADAALWAKAEPLLSATGRERAVTIPVGEPSPAGTVDFHAWIDGQPASEPDVQIHGDHVWELLFTSGTTAMLCSFLPVIYHCGHNSTVVPACLVGGTTIVGRRMDAAALAAAISAERATAIWAGSPLFLQRLVDAVRLDRAAYDLTSLTVAMFSWNTVHPDLDAALKHLCGDDLQLLEVFGQTESMSSYRFWLDQWPEKVKVGAGAVNYVGGPNPLLAGDVVDEHGRSLRDRPGVPGEAVYRSPVITAGYYRNEEATREAFRGGWFHSGDSCRYDEDGLQIMVDRYKDIVKSGGENVSSLRVESIVVQHPDVARVAVVGLPDERWGEIVTAVVVPPPGVTPDPDDVIAFCRARLAGYETPKRVVVMEELPETVGGKVLKYRLRETLRASDQVSSTPPSTGRHTPVT